jgi:hypothetical protein
MSDRANLYVRHKKNNNLILVTTEAKKRDGEETIMALHPQEAYFLGEALMKMGSDAGGAPA